MKRINRIGLWIPAILLFVLTSCHPGVAPIEYGKDDCHYCGMSIIEAQYGSEVITTKGKIRKFDAVECMIRFIRKNPDLEFSHIVVNVFDQPGELADASSCTYLVSENLPSPMGANLTAFGSMQKAVEVQEQKSGELYTWEEILMSKNL